MRQEKIGEWGSFIVGVFDAVTDKNVCPPALQRNHMLAGVGDSCPTKGKSRLPRYDQMWWAGVAAALGGRYAVDFAVAGILSCHYLRVLQEGMFRRRELRGRWLKE